METAEYWLMAWDYGIWNATIASLQFWTEDLDPITLGIASEHVYTHFFWTNSSHALCQLPEDALFGHLVITLNAAFTQQLSLADEGYESGTDSTDLPTPLRKMHHVLHVLSLEHVSFDPTHITPCRPVTTSNGLIHMPTRPVHHHLSFSSDQDHDTFPVWMDTSDSSRDASPEPSDEEESSNEEEDFQTVPMDNVHWKTEVVPERTFCIHKNGLSNNVCSYPCPYGTNGTTLYMDSLDLSDISDIEDHFLTTSDEEDLPGLEEAPYWTLVCLNTYFSIYNTLHLISYITTWTLTRMLTCHFFLFSCIMFTYIFAI